jgi:hypothetical protein
VIEGTADAPARRHVEICDRCRREVTALAHVVGELRAVEMPEPSPLFWDHLSRRIGERVRATDPAPASAGDVWRWPRARAVLSVAALCALVGVLVIGANRQPAGPAVSRPARGSGEVGLDRRNPAVAWQTVMEVASTVEWNGADPVVLPQGAADRRAFELTAEERRALASLLRAEIEQSEL